MRGIMEHLKAERRAFFRLTAVIGLATLFFGVFALLKLQLVWWVAFLPTGAVVFVVCLIALGLPKIESQKEGGKKP